MAPLREFMYPQTQVKDVELFMDIAGLEWDGTLEDIPNSVLVPSFMISELRTAFWIGFDEYGYADAAAYDDFHALQNTAVCSGRWMGTDHRSAGADVLLIGR